ncbi:MAG: HypC/HybG/HupF family hydrogenase formation chaperone [Alphaproteobacteria bacterium]|nr:HypC/HybG/HupF family hydrogenase formation chaperone [Alphaproteobacteria bacterium]
MCLAIPGQIISIEGEGLARTGRVQYGSAIKEASLAFVPLASIGDFILVHAGVAINIIDEAQAMTTFDYLDEIGELGEIRDK